MCFPLKRSQKIGLSSHWKACSTAGVFLLSERLGAILAMI